MYSKIIFVCSDNMTVSPMASAIFRSIIREGSIKVRSRGLVVLFPEPYNPKTEALLTLHRVPTVDKVSEQFTVEELDDETLVLTMAFAEKVRILEEFGWDKNLFTIKEFVEEDGDADVFDPYGGEEEQYEQCFIELKDLLYKVKKKLELE